MNLYVGQKLRCFNGEYAEIKGFSEDNVELEYKGKIYFRDLNIIEHKLFILEMDKTFKSSNTETKIESNNSDKTLEASNNSFKSTRICTSCDNYHKQDSVPLEICKKNERIGPKTFDDCFNYYNSERPEASAMIIQNTCSGAYR